jgi:hypothetical protein
VLGLKSFVGLIDGDLLGPKEDALGILDGDELGLVDGESATVQLSARAAFLVHALHRVKVGCVRVKIANQHVIPRVPDLVLTDRIVDAQTNCITVKAANKP